MGLHLCHPKKGNVMPRKYFCVLFLLVALLHGVLLGSELRVADVFTNHAVFQQDVEVPVWGTAPSGATVSVQFAGQTKTTTAKGDGTWRVELAPLKSQSDGSRMTVVAGDKRIEFHDVLVGEVWYASGQSNMQMALAGCARKIPEIREIMEDERPRNIRFLRIDEPDSPEPIAQRKTTKDWQVDSPENRRGQSAVAYFFARQLQERLDVPVGIIEGSWGGKPIEGFIPRDQFKKHDNLQDILSLADQNKLDELAKLEGGVVVRNTAGMPGRIFNARVAPIVPYAVRGFIWYQGESNAGRGEDSRNYRFKMKALVDGWRDAWNQPDLPFYFVQLPAFNDTATGWIRLREEQRLSLNIEHTGMAVTIDLRDGDIHPANKLDVGNRLALWALAKTYEKKLPFSGPLLKSAKVEGESMRVEFTYGDGLMVARKEGLAPAKPTPKDALAHFELADHSGKWHPATAVIDGDTILVNSPAVKTPSAVRYACSGSPANANLYNKFGLPAAPFCSDLEKLPWMR